MPSGILFLRFAGGNAAVSRGGGTAACYPENEAFIYIPCCEYSYRGDAAGAMPRCGKAEKMPTANCCFCAFSSR